MVFASLAAEKDIVSVCHEFVFSDPRDKTKDCLVSSG